MTGERRGAGTVRLGPGAEFDLIRRLLEPAGSLAGDVEVGPGDDCVVLAGGVALSVDLAVEGVHFRREWLEPAEIGYRAVAAALSDLAAVAAAPVGVLVSMALPPLEAETLAPALQVGVREAVAEAGGAVLGGDLARSPGPVVLDVVAAGRTSRPVLRSGARPGDEVWVTGHLGGSGAAVREWLGGREPAPGLRRAFARPRARTREALWLADTGALRALIDLSDGLAGDAAHLAAASGVRIVLLDRALPLHPGLEGAATAEALELALRAGEDYELLLTAEPGVLGPQVYEFRRRFDVALTRIGRVEAGDGVFLQEGDESGEERPLAGGFDHFRGDGSP